MSDERVNERLSSLARRTEPLRPRPGFQARVLLSVAREASALPLELARSARWFLPFALALALAAIGWAERENPVTSAELAQVELAWELSW
jgi:hypothetical protein